MEEYKRRLKRQNVFLWVGIALLAALDVVVGVFWDDLGFLDTRLMSQRARYMQSLLLFGFLIYFIIRLVMNKKMLKNPFQLEEEARWQRDERRVHIGEKAASWRRTWPWRGWWWRHLLSACTTWTLSTPCITRWRRLCCCGLGAGSIWAENIKHLAV